MSGSERRGSRPASAHAQKAREHGEHEELAVGEVHDLHETEDQRQPGRDERVDEPHEEAADEPWSRTSSVRGGQRRYLRSFHAGSG